MTKATYKYLTTTILLLAVQLKAFGTVSNTSVDVHEQRKFGLMAGLGAPLP